jgi:hypothetical protein
MPVTTGTLIGSWRALSIAGFTGPDSETLRFNGQGQWQGSDGCNDTYGTYQFGPARAFHLIGRGTTQVGCAYVSSPAHPSGGEIPTPPFPLAAVRVELLNGRLTLFARDGSQLAQYERTTDPRCTPKQLSATFGFVNNAQVGLGGLILTNHAESPCALSGSPDVRVVDSHGRDLMVTQSHGMAGNTPQPPPRLPITVAAYGGQPDGGVPMDWFNWCRPSPGPLTLHVRFPGWSTFLVATPNDNADTTPPCTDKTRGTGLGIYVVFEYDNTGFHGP